MLSWLKWLYPGMRVKRWLALTLFGIVLVLAGIVIVVNISWGDYRDSESWSSAAEPAFPRCCVVSRNAPVTSLRLSL